MHPKALKITIICKHEGEITEIAEIAEMSEITEPKNSDFNI